MAKKGRKPVKQQRPPTNSTAKETSAPPDRKGWKAEMAFVRALAAQPTRSGKNRWS